MLKTIEWKNNQLVMVDQRKLPHQLELIVCRDYQDVVNAIKVMAVRGAPAIGTAAAFGMALAALNINAENISDYIKELEKVKNELASTRPTAVNLFWALEKVWEVVKNIGGSKIELQRNILAKAEQIAEQDIKTNLLIGENGVKLFDNGDVILTHCNAGSLATVYYGTALGVIRSVFKRKENIRVVANETRPVLQGARITAWELKYDRIPVTLICDSTAGFLMAQGKISKVIVGADRIAANGDVANKIGTYSLSVLAKEHKIPFYVAAPCSTIDFSIKSKKDIPIEERNPSEVTTIMGKSIAPAGIDVYNPAFDLTPNSNITALITEEGIVKPPFFANLKKIKKNILK